MSDMSLTKLHLVEFARMNGEIDDLEYSKQRLECAHDEKLKIEIQIFNGRGSYASLVGIRKVIKNIERDIEYYEQRKQYKG